MTSLLRSHTNISMRSSSDKEIEAFDLDDLFNQYVETDLLQLSDNTAEPSSSDDLAHLFELPSNESDPIEASPMPIWEDAWHKALEHLEQKLASSTIPAYSFSIYPESHGKGSLSDPELFNTDNLFELETAEHEPRLSLSTPSTPRAQIPRSAKKATSNADRPIRNGIQKPTKKVTTFSKMLRPSPFRDGFQELWTRKIDGPADTFSLQLLPSGLSNSPPASAKLTQGDSSNGFQPYTIAMSPLPGEEPGIHQSSYQLTPLSSPTIDTNSRNDSGCPFQFSNDNLGTAYISHHTSSAALSALQTPPPSHGLPIATWGPETPATLDFTLPASPDYQLLNRKTQGWWGNGSTPAAPQPSSPTYHTSHARTTAQSSNMSFSTASVAGLGISCDTAPFSSFETDLGSANTNGHGTANGFGASASSFDIGYNTNTIYAPTSTNGIHIGNPRSSLSPSRSPSQSPHPQPRFTRRRHSSQNSTTRSHRRKSSNSSSQSIRRSNSAGVGFVNFTPDDSRKILTGVAPSGSSKTKARREKEAAEKRRKLSQAAVKAVMEAGGDLRELEENGLLSLVGE